MGEQVFSLVSNPSYRRNQCLVIPKRHMAELFKLTSKEVIAIHKELGRLAKCADEGFGASIFQKYAPKKPDDDVKVAHLHFHVIPRLKGDDRQNIIGTPQVYNQFKNLSPREIATTLRHTKH